MVRRIRCIREAARGTFLHDVLTEGCRGNHAVEQGDAAFDRINCVEGKLLVLLHILVVRKRNALHRGKKRSEGAVNTAGLAANQLGNIRVLLLGHDARTGRVGIVKFHKTVFI